MVCVMANRFGQFDFVQTLHQTSPSGQKDSIVGRIHILHRQEIRFHGRHAAARLDVEHQQPAEFVGAVDAVLAGGDELRDLRSPPNFLAVGEVQTVHPAELCRGKHVRIDHHGRLHQWIARGKTPLDLARILVYGVNVSVDRGDEDTCLVALNMGIRCQKHRPRGDLRVGRHPVNRGNLILGSGVDRTDEQESAIGGPGQMLFFGSAAGNHRLGIDVAVALEAQRRGRSGTHTDVLLPKGLGGRRLRGSQLLFLIEHPQLFRGIRLRLETVREHLPVDGADVSPLGGERRGGHRGAVHLALQESSARVTVDDIKRRSVDHAQQIAERIEPGTGVIGLAHLPYPSGAAGLGVQGVDHAAIRLHVNRPLVEQDLTQLRPGAIELNLRGPRPGQAILQRGRPRDDRTGGSGSQRRSRKSGDGNGGKNQRNGALSHR